MSEILLDYYVRSRQKGSKTGLSPWSPTTHFVVPEKIGPPTNEFQKLTPSDVQLNSFYGWATAMSGDGSTLVVGAYLNDSPIVDAGAVYVHVRVNGVYTQQAKLVASDAAKTDSFGRSVSISDDGNIVAVGSYQDDDGGSNSGSAYIFVRSGKTWSQQKKLVAYDPAATDFYGWAVTLSADGETLFIGSQQDDDNGSACGSGYLYSRNNGTWTLVAKFVPSEVKATSMFGTSCSLSSNGNVLVVGAYRHAITLTGQGAAFVFERTNGTWAKTAVLKASDAAASAYLGYCSAVSKDGTTIFVGAYNANSAKGGVYVYTKVNGVWTQQQKLLGTDTVAGDQFGFSLDCNEDGSMVAISAIIDKTTLTAQGAVYVFKKSGSTWSQAAKLLPSDPAANDNFGRAIAMCRNGGYCIMTATGASTTKAAAYVFSG